MFRSLRARLYAIVIGLSTIPVLVLGLTAGQRGAQVLEGQSLDLQSAIAARIEREITAFVGTRLSELRILDRTQVLATMSDDELARSLGRLLGHEQVFQALYMLDTEGRERARASRTEVNWVDAPPSAPIRLVDLGRPADAEPHIGPMRYEITLREPLLFVTLPIVNRRSGHITRFLVAELRLKRIWALLAELSLPGTTESYLVDATGQVLAHRLAATVLAGTRVDLPAHDGIHLLPSGDRVLTVMRRVSAISEPAFVLVTRRAYDALGEATTARNVTLTAAGVIALIATVVALLLSRQVTRPIESLAVSARLISTGELDAPIAVGGPSEIRELGGALTHMTSRLAEIISELEHSEYAERQRAMVTLESIGDAVITTDAKGVVRYINPVARSLTGWALDEAQGKSLTTVFDIINEHTREPAPDPVARCLAEGRVVGLANHSVLRSRNGREYAIQDSAAPIREPNGELLGAVMVFSDVTAARAMQQEISHQAMHDALTGLVNRRGFENRLKRVIATANSEGSEHALCYLDLDQFKVINDTCGHAAGDELLRQIAVLFQQSVRRHDTLCRLGGDEFAVLMEHCGLEQAQRVTDSLHSAIEELRFVWEDNIFAVGVSIGLVPITGPADTVDAVLRAADTACYLAKEGGRNRVHVYREDDADVTRRHGEMRWVGVLTRALEEGRFELHAQPIVALGDQSRPSKATEHFELLLRLVDASGERIRPAVFLPAAERYNLITRIDRWVIDRALEWLAGRPAEDGPVLCSINISGASVGENEFLDFVLGRFEATDVPGDQVCFEITETAAIGNLTRAARFIQAVRGLGCRFALDDFGSGLSSFAYLKTLRVDYLKIDGTFVKDMVEDPVDLAMVRSINDVGQLLGMKTVAEFVETEAILNKLVELGVDAVQGYHMGAPQPLIAA